MDVVGGDDEVAIALAFARHEGSLRLAQLADDGRSFEAAFGRHLVPCRGRALRAGVEDGAAGAMPFNLNPYRTQAVPEEAGGGLTG
jgi:hypothetical protein